MGNDCNTGGDYDNEYENQEYTSKTLIVKELKKEEYYIRKFEIEKYQSMSELEKSRFSYIISSLNFLNTKLIPKVKIERKLASSNFGKSLIVLIRGSQLFEIKESFYSVPKLKLLFFLLTKPEEKKVMNQTYFDKSSFIIQEVLTEFEEELSSNIEANNKNFNSLIYNLVNIAIKGITFVYMNVNGITLNEYFNRITNVPIEVITNKIILDLCSYKISTKKNLLKNDINEGERIKYRSRFDELISTVDSTLNQNEYINTEFTNKETSDSRFNSPVKINRLYKETKDGKDNMDNNKDSYPKIRNTVFGSNIKFDQKTVSNSKFSNAGNTQTQQRNSYFPFKRTEKRSRSNNKENDKNISGKLLVKIANAGLAFDFNDLNQKFNMNNYYLTVGYIRELADELSQQY